LFTVECGNASPKNDTVVLCDSVTNNVDTIQ
jgi:hypothetical protein